MVRFLLNHNPDLDQSACGNFFTPDDQKAFRKNVPNQELYELPVKTNYMGLVMLSPVIDQSGFDIIYYSFHQFCIIKCSHSLSVCN